MLLSLEENKNKEEEQEDELEEVEEEDGPKSHLNIIWDESPTTTTFATKVTSIGKYFEKDKVNENYPILSKTTISLDLTQNILGDLKLYYDVVEDLKKIKSNITIFELWKITQLREQLQEA